MNKFKLGKLYAIFGICTVLSLQPSNPCEAQMDVDGTILYGNEWIDYSKTYYKLKLSENGIYRVTYDDLVAEGFSPSDMMGRDLQLFFQGREVKIHTTKEGNFGPSDYLEFYGQRNRTYLDKFLYEDWEEDLLNPEYSFFTDTSSYFLTLNTGVNERYADLANNIPANPPTVEPYFLHTEDQIYSSRFNKPTYDGSNHVRYSHFDVSEGFAGSFSKSHNLAFDTDMVYANGPDARISIRTGSNNGSHAVEVSVNGDLQTTDSYSNQLVRQYYLQFPSSGLASSTNVNLSGTADNNDRIIISHAQITYPRQWTMNGESYMRFGLEGSAGMKYYEIENFDTSGDVVFYNITTGERIDAVIDGGVVKLYAPSSSEESELILVNESNGVESVDDIERRVFDDYSSPDYNYLILTSEMLMNDPENGGMDWIQEYADYRSSEQGGGFTTFVASSEELYDQFAYGIERHAIAVRNYLHYAQELATPQFAFIIGKGREYFSSRTNEDFEELYNQQFYVPTFGNPGSDNLLASSNTTFTPIIPIGRLAARTPIQVKEYLDKIILHESSDNENQTIDDQLWKKRIIHLSGGDANIQQILFTYLSNMANVIANNSFGADVITFRKFSSDPIQTSISTEILNHINAGTSIITFFGHSAVGTFDFSLEDPSQYDNFGRFPMIISLGCHSGNIHTPSKGLSEDFVIEPERGAIAFLASSSTAYISPQYISGLKLYDYLGNANYGDHIGNIIQKAILNNEGNQSLATRSLMQQLTFHGDPAIKFHPFEGPDYVVDYESIEINPEVVGAQDETMDVSFDVVNIGTAVEDSINVSIAIENEGGEEVYSEVLRIEAPGHHETIERTITAPGNNSLGKHVLVIRVDTDDEIAELPLDAAEQNNELRSPLGERGFCFYVLDNGARPIYPLEFGIVNDECPFVLRAATSNFFLEEQTYVFEIDTVYTFDSPWKKRTEFENSGGLIEWDPEIIPEEGKVYYWRVSPAQVEGVGYQWKSSSFTYLADNEASWIQKSMPQLLSNEFDRIYFNEYNQRLEFTREIWDFRFDLGSDVEEEEWIYVNGVSWGSLNPSNLGSFIGVHAQNPFDAAFKKSEHGDFGTTNSSNNMYAYKLDTPESRENFLTLLEAITKDHLVIIYSVITEDHHDFKISEWAQDSIQYGRNIFSELESYGAKKVRALTQEKHLPYVFVYRKGIYTVLEDLSSDLDGKVERTISDPLRAGSYGTLRTPIIGKSQGWNKAVIDFSELEELDSVIARVYVENEMGNDVLLSEDLTSGTIDFSSLNEIGSNSIVLELEFRDAENRSIPLVNNLQVEFVVVGDLSVLPHQDTQGPELETLQQGEVYTKCVTIDQSNCGHTDQVFLTYQIIDEANVAIQRDTSFIWKEQEEFCIEEDTRVLGGEYRLIVNYNKEFIHREQHHFDNIGITRFYVERDRINPLLDVKFDGANIKNGDIISSTPSIELTLIEENPFLPLADADIFELALEMPDGDLWSIDTKGQFCEFSSGDLDNIAELVFTPNLNPGDYTLYAQGRDASGNFSGNQSYQVDFTVLDRTEIVSESVVPSPAADEAEVVLILGGREAPDKIDIILYNSMGQIVLESTYQKPRIGRNQLPVSVADFPNGIYHYDIVFPTGYGVLEPSQIENRKFVVIR